MSQTSGRRVLVTGGAGFIGANLARRLVSEPGITRVRILDDFSSGCRSNLDDLKLELYEGSILHEDTLDEAAAGCTNIVHLAAVPSVPRSIADPVRSHEANATGTLRVLEAARRHGNVHVALASSSSVYGSNPRLPKSEDLQCQPMSPYAVSKLAGEQYAMAYAKCYDLPVMPFRFFNVYGPMQLAGHAYAAVIPAFVEAALTGKALQVHGDGLQTRDFTYVNTVVDVLTQTVIGDLVGSPTNLAYGTRTSLLQVAEMLRLVTGADLRIEFLPSRSGDVHDSQASSAKLRALCPAARPTHLDDGLRATAAWMATALSVPPRPWSV